MITFFRARIEPDFKGQNLSTVHVLQNFFILQLALTVIKVNIFETFDCIGNPAVYFYIVYGMKI